MHHTNQNAVISAERGPAMNTALGSLFSRPYYDAALSSFATYKRKRCDFRRAESPGWMAINCGVGQPCAKMPRVRNLILFTETLSKKAMKKALKCLCLNGFRGLWPLAGVAGILLVAGSCPRANATCHPSLGRWRARSVGHFQQ